MTTKSQTIPNHSASKAFSRAFNQDNLDLYRDIKVNTEILTNGGNHIAKLKIPGTCPRCNGDKTRDPIDILIVCRRCNGSGALRFTPAHNTIFIQTSDLEKCSECNGSGFVPTHPCPRCKGKGETMVKKAVKVTIPPNTLPDSLLRLRGMGLLDRDRGMVGDLFIKVKRKRFF
ncbi:MAG: zinc finger domain-containing protein [Candidatus Hodarchaeales archaeon]